jgi:maleylpyruvate isomerase
LSQHSALPGWTGGHLIAHVAVNADALGNLVHWAATGEPTPMYSSAADRAAGIEAGRRLPPHELVRFVRRSAAEL